jgi:D-beta-D-heptose 7-phosphate kinase/D-beta-D-heptose 1-phosphate adenosyltransferase
VKLELPRFQQARLLVIGDIMLDRYWEGGASRISPEAPVPVVRVEHVSERPGGAGNVALNIAALGAGVRLLGRTGDDEAADSLAEMLGAAGVDCLLQRDPRCGTTTKLRVVSRHQQLIRLDFEQSSPPVHPVPTAADLATALAGCDALVLSDYAKGGLQHTEQLIAAARSADLPVLVDPKGTDFARYRGADLLTPNHAEFEAVVGACPSEAELVARGEELMRELTLGALLVTRGEQGMTLLRPGAAALHLPARAREVFDVTGAGDTVIAAVAAAVAAGAELDVAVALANIAAALVVGRLGTAAPSAAELRREISLEQGCERGVLSLEQLQANLVLARDRGERIVFTNGCFDIVHAGHVSYLEQARALGDRLVVAVNDDASVRRLKGRGRPVNPVERRMAVLAGMQAVDWVLPFSGETPVDLLQALRPDVLVKGGDYRNRKDVVGWEVVEAYGGEVCIVGLVEHLSTTAIVDRIQGESEG